MFRFSPAHAASVVLALALGMPAAHAADTEQAPVQLTLQNHHFSPMELNLPAGTRVKLSIKNLDPTPAEFESDDFKAEKVLPSGQDVTLEIGPFEPGTYEFHDEYNEDESKSRIVVK